MPPSYWIQVILCAWFMLSTTKAEHAAIPTRLKISHMHTTCWLGRWFAWTNVLRKQVDKKIKKKRKKRDLSQPKYYELMLILFGPCFYHEQILVAFTALTTTWILLCYKNGRMLEMDDVCIMWNLWKWPTDVCLRRVHPSKIFIYVLIDNFYCMSCLCHICWL